MWVLFNGKKHCQASKGVVKKEIKVLMRITHKVKANDEQAADKYTGKL